MREIKTGEYYRHVEGGLYHVTGVAKDADTGRQMIVYQELDGNEELWVRSCEDFSAEVDRCKYPDAEQQYLFEKVEEPKETNPLLLRFLDTETYADKLELFQSWEAYADEQLLESIALSPDIVLGKRTTKEKSRQTLNCLKTMAHLETNRFR